MCSSYDKVLIFLTYTEFLNQQEKHPKREKKNHSFKKCTKCPWCARYVLGIRDLVMNKRQNPFLRSIELLVRGVRC